MSIFLRRPAGDTRILSLIIAVAFLLSPLAAQAGVITSATDATASSENYDGQDIGNTIDQSGLFTNYVSGVTDFDTYLATNPTHTLADVDNEWFSASGDINASVVYDIGSPLDLQRLALWNEEFSGFGQAVISSSLDGVVFSPLTTINPIDSPSGANYGAQVFDLGVTARYLRFELSGCPQSNGSSLPFCGIGEVAFDVGVTVPGPNDPVLVVTPSEIDPTVGSQVSVDVLFTNNIDTYVGDYDLSLAFDDSILSFTSIEFGPFLDGPSDAIQFHFVRPGAVDVFEISLGFLENQDGFTEFSLFTINFDVVGSGTSALDLSVFAIGDFFGDPLSVGIQNSSLTATGAIIDADGDGVLDDVDNCPTIANTDQADSNGDGFGDACVPADTVIRNGVTIGDNPVIGLGTVIRKDATIGDNVTLGMSVVIGKRATLGDNVSIGDQSKIRKDAQVGNNVSIGDNVTVAKNSQIGDDVQIGNGTIIRKNVVIGAGAIIGENVTIRQGATILPGATVPDGTIVPKNSTFPVP